MNTFNEIGNTRTSKKDEALRALQSAITLTLQYIENSKTIKCADRNTEYTLSQAWSDAAIKVRYVSKDLAVRLQAKADYWADQLEWSKEEVMTKGIDLQKIREEFRQLIANP